MMLAMCEKVVEMGGGWRSMKLSSHNVKPKRCLTDIDCGQGKATLVEWSCCAGRHDKR